MKSTLDVAWRLLGELGGFAVVVIGLSAWLSKIWAERILEKDRQYYREELERLKSTYESANRSLQAELDKTTHVHRVQFETEFKAFSEIWEKVIELRSNMAAIRPVVDSDAEGKEPMERYRTRLLRFSKTLAELKALVFKYAPFYPRDIYDLLWGLLTIAGREEVTVQLACQQGKRPNVDWFTQGETHVKEMLSQADEVSNAVRQRLEKLSFYPE